MPIKKGEINQSTWESIPSDLDKKALKRCSCCGEFLSREDFFDADELSYGEDGTPYIIKEETECKICKAKKHSGEYTLNLDMSCLSKYTKEKLEELREDYKEEMDNFDVDLETYIALTDKFSNFLRYSWYHLGLPEPTPAQIFFCDFLQYINEHTIVNAFRGIGKSWITSVYVVWRLWLNPELKILVVSASKERADSFSIFTKRLLHELPVVLDLIPNGERQSNKAFDVGDIAPAHAPSVKSAGITGQITGSRADLIIADDVEVIDNSATEDAREKLLEKCKDFVSILTPYKESRIIYLGTPQTEETIYDKLSESGYTKFVIPARYPEKLEKYKGYLASFVIKHLKDNPELVGHSVDPKRFTDEELLKRELMIGASTFALQFQLDTELSDAERYPLKTSDFIVYDIDSVKCPSSISYASSRHQLIKDIVNLGFTGDKFYEAGFVEDPMINYEGMLMFIDPSGRGTDETTYAVVGYSLGKLFLLDWGGFLGTGYSDEVMVALANKVKFHKVKTCIIEDNFGDGMYTKLFSPVIRKIANTCAIVEVKVHSNKEARIIDTLEPVLNQHRLIVSREAIKAETTWVLKDKRTNMQYSLLYQMTHISRIKGALKHDDRLDALAGAVKYWMDWLNKDVESAVKEAKERRLKEQVDYLIAIHGSYEINKAPIVSSRDKLLSRGGIRQAKGKNRNIMKKFEAPMNIYPKSPFIISDVV